MAQKILDRFSSLVNEGNSIYQKFESSGSGYNAELNSDFIEWQMKSKNILNITCGEESHYLSQFKTNLKAGMGDTNISILNRLIPILRAAEDDLKNGFLITIKQLVQADVFDSELEQAKSLLQNGYKNAAAVIAGTVLETAIKEICLNNGIELDRKKLTHLNDELAKAGIYNKLQQKQITALADIRNNAAHGDYDQFTQEHVERMIEDIEKFLLTYSS